MVSLTEDPMSNESQLDPGAPSGYTPEGFDISYAALSKMIKGLRLFNEVYGDDALPEDVAAFDFSGISELRRIAGELNAGAGKTFVDLACGAGGPGLWIARETGASLVGIDFSRQALLQARERAKRWQMEGRVDYRLADMAATGLADAAYDGALSIDALQFAADRLAVLKEVHRFLRSGARFVFTTWEERRPEKEGEPLDPSKVYDFTPLLHEAGFTVEAYEESEGWEFRQRGVYQATLKYSEEIIQEIGEQAASMLIDEARFFTELKDGKDLFSQIRRILVVGRKG